MPNRILRDWTDSRPIHSVKDAGEILFIRILMKADDYSRFHADPQLVRSLCFPLRDDLRNTDVAARLVDLQTAGLIRCYEIPQTGTSRWLDDIELAGAPAAGANWFLVIPKFGQQKRADKSKFPDPPPDDARMRSICVADDVRLRPYSNALAKAKALPDVPKELDTPEFREAWKDFIQHRKEIRHELTPTAAKTLLSKLIPMGGGRASAAMRHSIANGWQGVFEDKHASGGNTGVSQPRKSNTARVVLGKM